MTEAPDRLMFGDNAPDLSQERQRDSRAAAGALDHPRVFICRSRREDERAGGRRRQGGDGRCATSRGCSKLGFVEDPWGTAHRGRAGHGEARAAPRAPARERDPAAILAFYKERFAGDAAKLKDRLDGLKLSGRVAPRAARRRRAEAKGTPIDHIGFRTSDLAAKTTELKAQSVKFTTEPRPLKLASGAVVNFAYLEGPAGAKVELVQR